MVVNVIGCVRNDLPECGSGVRPAAVPPADASAGGAGAGRGGRAGGGSGGTHTASTRRHQ